MTTAPASTIPTVQHTDQEQQQTEHDAVEAWRLQQRCSASSSNPKGTP